MPRHEATPDTQQKLAQLPARSRWKPRLQRLYKATSQESTAPELAQEDKAEEETTLDLANAGVSVEMVACLHDYLSYVDTPLLRLNLSRNPIGVQGAKTLGHALLTNSHLMFLQLAECELVGSAYRPQFDGLLALSKGLQSVRSDLRFLDVANNSLTPEGCRIMLGAVSFHPTLTALDISCNLMGLFDDKQGFMSLAYFVEYNKHAIWLNVARNHLPKHAMAMITTALAGNCFLTSLDVSESGFDLAQLERQLTAQQMLVLWDLRLGNGTIDGEDQLSKQQNQTHKDNSGLNTPTVGESDLGIDAARE